MSIEITPPQPPERQSVSSVFREKFRENKSGLTILGIGCAEVFAAEAIHNYALYPQEVAMQQKIDTQIGDLRSKNDSLQIQLDAFRADRAVFSRYDQSAPPQLLSAIDGGQSTIDTNQTTMATLQQEYPSTPITTNEILGVLGGTTIVALGALLAVRNLRFRRRAQAEETSQDE